MWQPMHIRHRSAYYDAFFTEALLSYGETGLAAADEAAAARRADLGVGGLCLDTPAGGGASRRAISEMVDSSLTTSAEAVPSHDGSTVRVVPALAPLPHPRFSR